MARLGPFEPRPLLAVAVSGGADSVALTLLAHRWVRQRRGRVLALTVDHGLRPESHHEARQVADWMQRRGIAHRILSWTGHKSRTGLPEAAREARYRLLLDACRREGALHLLLGQTRDDQAETVLMRLAAGSGPHGLAGMAEIQERAEARLLRPLLGMAHAELTAYLRQCGQAWVEDPTNRDDRFARVRLRQRLAVAGPRESRRLASAAAELGRARAAEDRAIGMLLARAATLFPEGFARLAPAPLLAAEPALARRALAALLATVGGTPHHPSAEAVEALRSALDRNGGGQAFRGATLGRCRIVAEPGGRLLIVREMRGLPPPAPAASGAWDGRMTLRVTTGAPADALSLGPLGDQGWAEAVARRPALRGLPVPHPARLALPALWEGKALAALPQIGHVPGTTLRPGRKITAIASFRPLRPLAPAAFAAAPAGDGSC